MVKSSSPTNEYYKNRANSRHATTVILYVIGIIFIVAFSILEEGRNVSRINTLQQQQVLIHVPRATTTVAAWSDAINMIKTNETVFVVSSSTEGSDTKIMIPQNSSMQQRTWPSQRPHQHQRQQQSSINTPPSPPSHRVHRNITLIVQLRGELGNQLSVLANARVTQLLAHANYPHIHIQLIGQHQYDAKWTKGRDDLVKCFSNAFHDFDFEGGIYDDEFHIVQNIQHTWLNEEQRNKLSNVRSFHFLDSLLLQQEKNNDDHYTSVPILPSSVSKYSLPYLTASSFSWIDCLRSEWYYNEIRQWLSFNMNECCNVNVRPNANDIVFHYRNFEYELRKTKRSASLNFMEISPDIAANVAFIHHTLNRNNSDQNAVPNIAITSRYEAGTEQYIAAFQSRNLTSHYVSGQQNGVEGFCYILQAQKETFGSYHSTYYRWAALLGNATINRFYTLSPFIITTNHSNSSAIDSTATTSTNVVAVPEIASSAPQPLLELTAVTTVVQTMETIYHHHRVMIIEKYIDQPTASL